MGASVFFKLLIQDIEAASQNASASFSLGSIEFTGVWVQVS